MSFYKKPLIYIPKKKIKKEGSTPPAPTVASGVWSRNYQTVFTGGGSSGADPNGGADIFYINFNPLALSGGGDLLNHSWLVPRSKGSHPSDVYNYGFAVVALGVNYQNSGHYSFQTICNKFRWIGMSGAFSESFHAYFIPSKYPAYPDPVKDITIYRIAKQYGSGPSDPSYYYFTFGATSYTITGPNGEEFLATKPNTGGTPFTLLENALTSEFGVIDGVLFILSLSSLTRGSSGITDADALYIANNLTSTPDYYGHRTRVETLELQ